MKTALPDSRLNEPERRLQHTFRKLRYFNSLLVFSVVLAAYPPIRALPDRKALPDRAATLHYRPVSLAAPSAPLRLAGAWEMTAADRRFGGLSALVVDRGRFVAVSDLGAVLHFDPPSASRPRARLTDLAQGPGSFGRKTSRDAESLARDPRGRGWWVGFEQKHSLWLYDPGFGKARVAIALNRPDWWRNRGIEGLVADGDGLLAFAENGREAFRIGPRGLEPVPFSAPADVAEAARAPDGSIWLLLRSKSLQGISQSIVRLQQDGRGYRVGRGMRLPKAPFDNFEGIVIAPRPNGDWRIWLITDDGHRLMARNLLVALDFRPNANARRIPPGANKPDLRKS